MRIGLIGSYDVHWGLVFGVVACVVAALWLGAHDARLRDAGGRRQRARGAPGRAAGGRLVITACALGGAAAGLAGGIEVAAVHGAANASLIAGFGYTGILVASSRATTRWRSCRWRCCSAASWPPAACCSVGMGLPDASVQVLMGFCFVLILASEALRGRLSTLIPGWSPARQAVPA